MAYLLVALVLVLSVALLRAPVWVHAIGLALAASLAVALGALGGLERASAPIVVTALALGLLVPAGTAVGRHPRIAPAKRKPKASTGGKGEAERSGGFEGTGVPGFELLEKVGSGGMASVYRARRLRDGTIVALKVPMEQYVADAKFIRRFHREAEVAQRLDHPNIVRTYEHGAHGVQHYMAMEYVDGRSLETLVESGELDLELTVDVMKLAVKALMSIHKAGIIHRDIKPGNIMIVKGGMREDRPRVTEDGVKLMDFGIAGGKVMSRLTMTGARVGTPVYMSPEQARGLKIDHRSDIYSLGLVLYEMLTGQTAFKGGYEAIVHQQIFQTPAPPRQLDLSVPQALDALVMRMIAKEADERPTLREVLEILEDEAFEDGSDEDMPSRLVLTIAARQGVIRVMDLDGALRATFGDVGVGANAFPAAPLSVAVDAHGCFYAALFEYRIGEDEGDHHMIHKLAPDGTPMTRFGRYGVGEGEFLYPASVAVGPDDDVYVLDGETLRVQRFSSDGEPKGAFGGRGRGKGTFDDPRVVVAGRDGNVYVLDYGNRQVQRFTRDGVYQTRWAFRVSADDEGMRVLDGVTVSADGCVFISDATAGRIRMVTPEGRVAQSYPFDALHGEGTEGLMDLGLDHEGNLYAGRRGGHLIRKFAPDGTHLTTLDTYAPLAQMLVDVRSR